jgi:hypothetical protein
MEKMTLKQMLYLQNTVNDADKWRARWKAVRNYPQNNEKAQKKEHEMYNNWVEAEEKLDNLLTSILT